MKKHLIWGCACLLAVSLAACTGGQPVPGAGAASTPAPEASASPAPKETVGWEDILAVLRGEEPFYDTSTGNALDISRLREALTPDDLPLSVPTWAAVDLDGDGMSEAVLQIGLGDNPSAGFEVLHARPGGVYGYTLSPRTLQELKADGTCLYSGGAADWGIGSLTFGADGYELAPQTWCASDGPEERYFVNGAEADETAFQAAVAAWQSGAQVEWRAFPPDEADALAAYGALLAREPGALDRPPAGLELGEVSLPPEEELEYTLLDLDGDGGRELLLQWVEEPGSFNAVFHYGDGELSCWQYDNMEGSCRDYPLRDGTMVRQYDVGTGPTRYSHLYTLFRYLPSGETQEAASLAIHEDTPDGGAGTHTYLVDGEEVDQAAFEARFETLVGGRLLDRTAWTPAAQWDGTG